MPYTQNTQEIPMLWRIEYDHNKYSKPQTLIIRWDTIIAVRNLMDVGQWMIRIYFMDTWIQFTEKNTPDAVALLEMWNNQCIMQEYQ